MIFPTLPKNIKIWDTGKFWSNLELRALAICVRIVVCISIHKVMNMALSVAEWLKAYSSGVLYLSYIAQSATQYKSHTHKINIKTDSNAPVQKRCQSMIVRWHIHLR